MTVMDSPIMIKSIVRSNAEKDPNYCPYCMRCSDLVRMKKVNTLLWKCKCGAIHDERDVQCPSCKGNKTANATSISTPCLCCQGVGTITKDKADNLSRISRDLNRKLLKQGICLPDLNGK